MRYVIDTVMILYILDYAITSIIVEIHVDIRHGYSFRVKETLEQEVVLDRVQVGDTQAVSHCGTSGGTTSGSYGNAVCTSRGDVVLNDEEVVRETHSRDSLQLEVQSL